MNVVCKSLLKSRYGRARWRGCSVLLALIVISLESCQGLIKPIGPGTGETSKTALVVTLRAAPLPPAFNINLLSFRVSVIGLSLTPSTGGSVSVPLNSDSYQVDLTRLQSDSTILAVSTSIPAGTYSNMVVSLSDPAVTYCTQLQGLTGCPAASVTTVSGASSMPIVTATPFPLVVHQGQSTGLAVTVDIEKALTVNAQTQAITAVNLGAADVLTPTALPRNSSSLPLQTLDFIEDITGIVSSVDESMQSLNIQTATKGTLTVTAESATVVSSNCTTFGLGNTFACAKEGQVASCDAILNPDGSLSLLQYDPLSVSEGDWIEGIVGVPPSSSSQFEIVANEFVFANMNSLIKNNLNLGAPVRITLVNPKPFVVDSKDLVIPSTGFSGATDASVLSPGQTLALHIASFTPSNGTSLAAANVDFVYLRFTRVTGSVASTAPPSIFAIESLPPFFGLSAAVSVQLSTAPPGTNFDGVTAASELSSGQTVAIRALYFGQPTGPTPTPSPFSAAKVRTF